MVFGLTAVGLGPVFLPNLLFLRHAGETTAYADIVRYQQSAPVLYGAGFVDNSFKYKLELVRQRKPDVVAVGSSRVFFMQQDFFRAPFVNAGGAARSVAEAKIFVNDMLAVHSPKVVLLGLDYFWFNKNSPVPRNFAEHSYDETAITRYRLLQPILWVKAKHYSFRDYLRIMRGSDLSNPNLAYATVGLFAILRGNGFRGDGSHVNSYVCSGGQGDMDRNFKASLPMLKSGGWGLGGKNEIDPERLRDLGDLISVCERNGVSVVCYLTPVTGAVYDELRANPDAAAYLDELENALSSLFRGRDYYNALDIRGVGASDCEAIDAHHAGNVVCARLLRRIGEKDKASRLAPFLDAAALERTIRVFSGNAMAYADPSLIRFDEVDFLGLGCHKKTRAQIRDGLRDYEQK